MAILVKLDDDAIGKGYVGLQWVWLGIENVLGEVLCLHIDLLSVANNVLSRLGIDRDR